MIASVYIVLTIAISVLVAKLLLHEKNLQLTEQENTNSINYNNTTFYYQISTDNLFTGNVESIWIFLSSSSDAIFSFRRKTKIEKALIGLRWLRPFKTGNRYFDNFIYVASDDTVLQKMIYNKKIQSLIVKILDKETIYNSKSIEIFNSQNEFGIKLVLDKKQKKKNIDIIHVLNRYAEDLSRLYSTIDFSTLTPQVNKNLRIQLQPIKFLLLFCLSMSFFLFIYEVYICYPSTIDLMAMQFLTILGSFLFSLLIMGYLFKKIKKSSFKLDIGVRYFIWSMFASFTIILMGVKYLNTTFDNSTATVVTDTITGKHQFGTSKPPRRYYFNLKNTPNAIHTNDIRVHKELYDTKSIGDTVSIYVKQGNLNIRWIEFVK